MSATITVKAYAVLLDASRTRHAVWVGEDPTKTPVQFTACWAGTSSSASVLPTR